MQTNEATNKTKRKQTKQNRFNQNKPIQFNQSIRSLIKPNSMTKKRKLK